MMHTPARMLMARTYIPGVKHVHLQSSLLFCDEMLNMALFIVFLLFVSWHASLVILLLIITLSVILLKIISQNVFHISWVIQELWNLNGLQFTSECHFYSWFQDVCEIQYWWVLGLVKLCSDIQHVSLFSSEALNMNVDVKLDVHRTKCQMYMLLAFGVL